MVSRDPERRYQRDKVDQLELPQQPLGGIVLPAVVPPSLSAMRPKPSDDPAVQFRWSGRIEARIGLRMMPTFPRSPLSFRTASFPQYGWKADCPSGAFLGDRRLKPAPGIRRPPSSLHPPFVHFVVATMVRSESGLRTRSCTVMRWNTPPTPGALARVRVVVSRSVIT